ncbi:ATP-binding protein [Pseudomonas coleopterorum]|nr:ATP-binding protein [Pseudomonas coleopterorum]MDY1048872.1 ATP-binding protein [Pseudomonas coleopterorum]
MSDSSTLQRATQYQPCATKAFIHGRRKPASVTKTGAHRQEYQFDARHDLLEVIDNRTGSRSTVMTSQLLVEHWHGWVNDLTIADALLDRLVHSASRVVIKGEPLRRQKMEEKAESRPTWLQFRPRAMGAEISHVVSGMTGQNDRNTHYYCHSSPRRVRTISQGPEPRFFSP